MWRIVLVSIVGIMLSAVLEAQRIGKVKQISGVWCRNGNALAINSDLSIDDDVRYCSKTLSEANFLIVEFDGPPKHERIYYCSTKGICDQRTKLWLRGAYLSPNAPAVNGTLLISRPNVGGIGQGASSRVLPDIVTTAERGGARLPSAFLQAVANETIDICRISSGQPVDCASYFPSLANQLVPLGAGIYAIYRGPVSLSALLVIAPPGSDWVERWNQIPEPFRTDTSATYVNERRRYLLGLVNGLRP